MREFFLFILALFILLKPVLAEEIILNLDEAIAIGLRDNLTIRLNTEEINKAKEILAQAYAGLLPSLTVTAGWQDTVALYDKDISAINTQLTLKQPLYQGGRVINTISLNKDKVELTQVILDKTKLEIVLAIKKAFYTLMLVERTLAINQKILNNIQAHLNVLKERYRYGEVSESEMLNIESSLKTAQNTYTEALNQKEQLQTILRNLLSLKDDVIIIPQGGLFYEPKEIIYEIAFLEALSHRPEIREYELKENIARKNIELNRSLTRPQVFASWNYYSNSRTTSTFGSQKGWQDYQTLGITLSWPIFDGWLTQHKVREAMVDLKETMLLKEKVRQDIALELKEAYISLKNAISKIDKTNAELLFYEDNLKICEEKYKKGEVSLLDKEDAQLKYEIALFNKEEAIYDYLLAKARFDKATGGI